jgi:hypothetical protein
MADQIRRVDYFYVEVPDKPGEGVRVLTALKEAGVNLLNFTAFPGAGGKAQLDLVVEDAGTGPAPWPKCFASSRTPRSTSARQTAARGRAASG